MTTIANVIRRDQNATLARSIEAYLKDQGFTNIPSPSTMQRTIPTYTDTYNLSFKFDKTKIIELKKFPNFKGKN